jgi:hypothetical protein
MVPGMIMLWHGTVASIPSGWHLCDGTAGTIDLRDYFVPCAGFNYTPGQTGGSNGHSHNFTTAGHNHNLDTGTGVQIGSDLNYLTNTKNDGGTTQISDSRPAFKALCYIQKL